MNATPSNTNDLDQVEPRFVAKVALLVLAIHIVFGCETYGPYAVIVLFGCWRTGRCTTACPLLSSKSGRISGNDGRP